MSKYSSDEIQCYYNYSLVCKYNYFALFYLMNIENHLKEAAKKY